LFISFWCWICGWSDHFSIHVSRALDVVDDSQLGPFDVTPEEYQRIISTPQDQEAIFAGQRCCTSDQWQGYMFSWDESRHFRAGFNISYDYTNKRTHVLIEEQEGNRRRRVIETIALYQFKKVFIIDHNTQQCHEADLEGDMRQDCVPQNATHAGQITIGGELPANIWEWEEGPRNSSRRIMELRTVSTCTPIDSFVTGRFIHVDVNYYWNITQGIKDPSIFAPPKTCKPNSKSPYYSIVKELHSTVSKQRQGLDASKLYQKNS